MKLRRICSALLLSCLLLWGLLALGTMLFANPVLCELLRRIPRPVTLILQWGAAGLLAVDFITTAMAVLGMKVTARRLSALSEGMQQTSRLLENRLTVGVQRRMQKSFPAIDREVIAEDFREKSKAETAIFAAGWISIPVRNFAHCDAIRANSFRWIRYKKFAQRCHESARTPE